MSIRSGFTLVRRPPFRRSLLALLLGSLIALPAAAQAVDTPALALPFGSFFKLPVGPRGLEISDTLRQAHGQAVVLVGYMVAREDATPGRFQLTPRPVRLSEHADGEADDLPPATVTVLLHPSQANRVMAHQPGPIRLQGRLQVGREEDTSGRVSWFRLLLDEDALAPSPVTPVMPAPRH